MKQFYVLISLIFFFFFFSPKIVKIEGLTSPKIALGREQKSKPTDLSSKPIIANPSQPQLEAYVDKNAVEIGINPELANCIISHESQWIPSKKGNDTGNTLSRGLWQWNNYWHPEIKDACAYDAKCATAKALPWIKSGHVKQWSTYNQYCSRIPVLLVPPVQP